MRIILLFVLFLSFCKSYSKDEFSPRLIQSYQCLFKLKLDSSHIFIVRNEIAEPDNHVNKLMECYLDFVKILLTEDYAIYNQWKSKFDSRVNAVKKADDKSPFKQYILGEIYIQSCVLKFKFGDQVGGMLDFRKGYGYLADNEKDFPHFPYHKKSLGFIHVILSFVPGKYRWFLEGLGFDTDYKKGKQQLQSALQNTVVTHEEAFVLNQWIAIQLENKKEAGLGALSGFADSRPDYKVAQWAVAMVLKNENRVAEASEVIERLQPNSGFFYSPYFYFVNGQIQLLNGDYEKSKACMSQFLAHYKGRTLRKSAFYHMYLADYLLNNKERLHVYKDSVMAATKTNSEMDRIARKMLEENPAPNVGLLKARLFFDGGYFEKSMDELNKLHPSSLTSAREQVEYYYRKARVFDAKSDKSNALKFYQLTIEKQKSKSFYFAPNAYLQMAKCVSKENKKLAKEYLAKIDDYDEYEYQAEIEYEAKALEKGL